MKVHTKLEGISEDFYRIGLFTLIPTIVVIIVFLIWGEQLTTSGFGCVFHKATGAYCPGCGGTRALQYMIHGHLIQSFLTNPFVVCFFAEYLFFMISAWLYKHTKFKYLTERLTEILIYSGVTILLLQCVVRNILWFGFHIGNI